MSTHLTNLTNLTSICDFIPGDYKVYVYLSKKSSGDPYTQVQAVQRGGECVCGGGAGAQATPTPRCGQDNREGGGV